MSGISGLLVYLQDHLHVLARIYCFFHMAPGVSAQHISGPVRLLLSFTLALLFAPLATQEASGMSLAALLENALTGFLLGLVVRLFFDLFLLVGSFMAHQLSLTSSSVILESATDTFSVFFQVYFTALFFTNDLHFPLLKMLVSSYSFLSPQYFGDGNFLTLTLQVMTHATQGVFSFMAPFLVFALLYGLLLGLLNRMVPALPVFFVMRPLDFLVMLGILYVALPYISKFFQYFFQTFWMAFF